MSGPEPRAATGRAAVPGRGDAAARDRPAGSGPGRYAGRAAVPGGPPPGGPPPGGPRPPGRVPPAAGGRRPWRRILLVITVAGLLVALLGGGGLALYARGLDANMGRTTAFAPLAGDRPAKIAPGTLDVLLLGSDSRDPDGTAGPFHADTIILMHVPASGDQAYLISIPRDLWVYVPPNADGTLGGHEAKINAATNWGGVPLMVQTVEGYTGVRIDHVMLLDFGGFVEVTDALGGVDMHIDQAITSIHAPNRTFTEGPHRLNGEEALDYIRQRKQFVDGDFTRMRNQQQFLKALMEKAAGTGTLTNPVRLNAFLQTATSTLTVDEDFSLLSMGLRLRNLRSHSLTFLTSPNHGGGFVGNESVVFSDEEGAGDLFRAVREDRVARWVAGNGEGDSGT